VKWTIFGTVAGTLGGAGSDRVAVAMTIHLDSLRSVKKGNRVAVAVCQAPWQAQSFSHPETLVEDRWSAAADAVRSTTSAIDNKVM